jgi:adenylate cyclase
MMAAGASMSEMVQRTVEAQDLAISLTSVLRMMMRQHLAQSIDRHQRAFAGMSRQALMMPMAVGFIDLVGFTPLSADLNPQQLSDVVARFEAIANDTITALGGRLVKLIGDEVMFVAVDPADGCRIAAGLLERFGADRDLNPRGGMAFGPVLARGGDYFGSTVNVAARLVDQAVPGEVLLTSELAALAPMPGEPGGRRMLKGFRDPVLVSSLTVS